MPIFKAEITDSDGDRNVTRVFLNLLGSPSSSRLLAVGERGGQEEEEGDRKGGRGKGDRKRRRGKRGEQEEEEGERGQEEEEGEERWTGRG